MSSIMKYRSLSKILQSSSRVVFNENKRNVGTNEHTVATKSFDEIPGPSGIRGIPYLGTALLFKPFTQYTRGTLDHMFASLRDEYGDIVKFRSGKSWTVVLFNDEYSKQVLTIPMKYPYRPTPEALKLYSSRNKTQLGFGASNGKDWANGRLPAQDHMLKPKAVASYVPMLSFVADDLISMLRPKGRIEDCLATTSKYAVEIIWWCPVFIDGGENLVTMYPGRDQRPSASKLSHITPGIGMLCFNRRLGTLTGESYKSIVDDVNTFFELLFKPSNGFFPYRYFRTPSYNRFERATKALTKIAKEETQKAAERLSSKSSEELELYLKEEPNLLYNLLCDTRLTTADAESILSSLFLAGIESTANTITFLWHELAKHPQAQSKLYEEINNIIGKGKMTKDSLSKMPYLKACVKENMRLNFPVIPGPYRRLDKDCCIGGYHIPKKTEILPSMINMSMDPRYYKDPKKFIPERFLRTNDTLNEEMKHTSPFGYLPFGFGARNCVGQRFAENEIFIVTTKLFQNFEVTLDRNVPTTLDYEFRSFRKPMTKVSLNLKERT